MVFSNKSKSPLLYLIRKYASKNDEIIEKPLGFSSCRWPPHLYGCWFWDLLLTQAGRRSFMHLWLLLYMQGGGKLVENQIHLLQTTGKA